VANGGKLMRPTIIEKVIDHQKNTEIPVEPVEERQVISAESAATVSQMMEYAAQHGEAQWISSKTHSVAGKTGTAQIPVDGQYAEDKTIASFIGFSPVENPRFVMLVTLREPKSSPWAAETAAPLWYSIANKLYLLLNIPADR
jgi:cell division protein FtsI/penicillin-binding protein 2